MNYDELVKHDLISDFNNYSEIVCNIQNSHAKKIKRSWSKYERYARAHTTNPGRIKNFFLFLIWMINQVYMDMKYVPLSVLSRFDVHAAEKLEPVEFAELDDVVAVHFRKKAR